MAARPYKLFGTRERTLLRELLEQRLGDWARGWLPGRSALRVECVPAVEAAARFADRNAADWLTFEGTAGEWWAIAAGESAIDTLAAALCGGGDGPPGRSAIVAEAALSALEDLAAALLGAQVSRMRSAPPLLFGAGSASIAATVAAGEASLALVSSAQWTLRALRERLPAPPPARLVARRQAIAARPVALRVVAGWAELELSELRRLETGDLIALDARIDRPLSLVLGDAPLCGARLGVRDGQRAVTLTAAR